MVHGRRISVLWLKWFKPIKKLQLHRGQATQKYTFTRLELALFHMQSLINTSTASLFCLYHCLRYCIDILSTIHGTEQWLVSHTFIFFSVQKQKKKKITKFFHFFFSTLCSDDHCRGKSCIQFLVVWSFFSLKHTKWNLWCHILLQSETITWQSMPTVFHCLCEKAYYSNFPFKNKSGKPPHLTLHQIQGITNAN